MKFSCLTDSLTYKLHKSESSGLACAPEFLNLKSMTFMKIDGMPLINFKNSYCKYFRDKWAF